MPRHPSILISLLATILMGGCGDKTPPDPTPKPEVETPAESPEEPVVEDEPSANVESGKWVVHRNLLQEFHQAELYDQGLFIPFGSLARHKYTNGNWNSGWSKDAGGSTRFSKRGRIYFQLDEKQDIKLRFRLKGLASTKLISYMNGDSLPEASVEQGKLTTAVVPVSESLTRAGENYLQIRGETPSDSGSFEIHSVQVFEGDIPENVSDKAPASLTKEDVSGVEVSAAKLKAGAKLVYYVRIPANGALQLSGVGEGSSVKTRIQAEGGQWQELEEKALTSEISFWTHSLSAFADKVVRIELSTDKATTLKAISIVRAKQTPTKITQAKNVIWLTIDTLGAHKLRPYNKKTRVKTPALDRFAKDGVVFEQAQTPENWTKPSVASMLTGLFPQTHKTQGDASSLPADAKMITEMLKAKGITTGGFIANGYVSGKFGFEKGWDEYTNYIRETKNTNASNVFKEAGNWIAKNKGKRFFAYIQTIDPHVPYDPPDNFLKMYDSRPNYDGQVTNRRTHLLLEEAKKKNSKVSFSESDIIRIKALHDGEISYHDSEFKKFLKRVDELGLRDNTVFVVTSDHGEEQNEHGSWGHGHSVYQELLGVPLIIRWPGVAKAGKRVSATVTTLDLAPTVFEAMGVPAHKDFEGRSLVGHLTNNPPAGPHVAFSYFQDNRRVIRSGRWKLIIRPNLRYTVFDLQNDPKEKKPLTGREHPIAMRHMRILSGQFLGARGHLGNWMHGGSKSKAKTQQAAELNPVVCAQMKSIGYIIDGCEKFLN